MSILKRQLAPQAYFLNLPVQVKAEEKVQVSQSQHDCSLGTGVVGLANCARVFLRLPL